MVVGEGLKIAGAIAASIAGVWLFIEGMAWVGRQWSAMVDEWSDDEAARMRAMIDGAPDYGDVGADALIPGYAAEALARARVRDGCGCHTCRSRRGKEPCSDYDED